MKAFFSSIQGGGRRDSASSSTSPKQNRTRKISRKAMDKGNIIEYQETPSYREAAALKGIGPSVHPTSPYQSGQLGLTVENGVTPASVSPKSANFPANELSPTQSEVKRKSWQFGTGGRFGAKQQQSSTTAAASTPTSDFTPSPNPSPNLVPLIPISTSDPNSVASPVEDATITPRRKRSIRIQDTPKAAAKDPPSRPISNWSETAHGTPAMSSGAHEEGLNGAALAERLNELAVAHGDGLLSTEEYRTLRQGLFDSMRSRELELPIDRTIHGVPASFAAAVAQGSPPLTSASEGGHGSLSHARQSSSKPPSLHSQRSSASHLASIFRNHGKSDSNSRDYPPSSYAGHGSSSHLGHAGSDRDSLKPPSSRPRRASPSGGSIANGSVGPSSASTLSRLRAASMTQRMKEEEMQREFSAARSSRSIMMVGPVSPGYAHSVATSAELLASGSNDGSRSVAEIKAEVATVELEKSNLLDRFDALHRNALSKSPAGPYLRRARSSSVLLQNAATSSVKTGHTPPAVANGSRSIIRRFSTSFNRRRSSTLFDQTDGTVHGGSSNPSASPDAILQDDPADKLPPEDAEMRKERQRLQQELDGIRAQRESMTKRYDERIAYLRSTMRSAAIKEKATR